MSSIIMPSPVVTSSSAAPKSRATSRGRIALIGLVTVVAAVLANVVVFFIGGALIAYDPQFLPLANVSGAIIFTLPCAIVAVLVYAALLRFARKPTRTFTIVAAVVLVVSVIPDFSYIPSVPGATGGQIATLVLMHTVAAMVIVRMLTALARRQAR